MSADRIDNRNMLAIADVIVFVEFSVGDFWTGRNQPIQQRDVDRHKDGVTWDFRQHTVEINIGADKQRIVTERLTVDF
ncbi:hypothetical protein D3C81_2081270 [compost metagenome]